MEKGQELRIGTWNIRTLKMLIGEVTRYTNSRITGSKMAGKGQCEVRQSHNLYGGLRSNRHENGVGFQQFNITKH